MTVPAQLLTEGITLNKFCTVLCAAATAMAMIVVMPITVTRALLGYYGVINTANNAHKITSSIFVRQGVSKSKQRSVVSCY